ncbi:MAG: hypothetical protein AMXMBFR84_09350 [Candidatus Hydrogenedentota bacterium]
MKLRGLLTSVILLAAANLQAGAAFTGTVKSEQGAPIASVYVGLFSDTFDSLGQGLTGSDGAFSIPVDTMPATGHLVVQPPAGNPVDGIAGYAHSPRVYKYQGEPTPTLTLPEVATIAVRARDSNGNLLRWQEFRARGLHGDQFIYATNLKMDMAPAVIWPVYDEEARQKGSAREIGLPALAVKPGEPCAVQVLFWETRGYGKLWLRADNAGKGFAPATPGETMVIDLNLELARTAVADLVRRSSHFPESSRLEIAALSAASGAIAAIEDPLEQASKADELLVIALRLRDELEVALAKASAPSLRNGTAELTVTDADGKPAANQEITLKLQSREFHFGVFEGGQYTPSVYKAAREAGFDMSTLLLGWGWIDTNDAAGVDKTYGIQQQKDLGFTLKAHGVVWLQGYGILPERAFTMPSAELRLAAIDFQQRMLESYFDDIAIWESMNEPPATNAVNLSREEVTELFAAATESIEYKPELVSLVNAAHEIDFGAKYSLFNVDGTPANAFPLTYSQCLDQLQASGKLAQLNVVGLQFYPGFRFGDRFQGLQGPAVTPASLVDLADRYAEFGKPVHITEFSLPDQYGPEAKNGYWREKWSPELQAEFAELVYTIAYGHPSIESITWWDITDRASSVVGGGLMSADGKPKPVMTRLESYLESVSPAAITVTTDAEGKSSVQCPAGIYVVDGTDLSVHVEAGETATIAVAGWKS